MNHDRNIFTLITVAFVALLPASCNRATTTSSNVKIVGGIQIDKFEAVQRIVTERVYSSEEGVRGSCTITFVSDNTAVTAGHCVYNESLKGSPQFKAEEVSLADSKVQPLEIIGMTSAKERIGDSKDFAVLVFPDNTSKSWVKLATTPPTPSQAVALVGFGHIYNGEYSSQADYLKRVGTNKVADFADNQVLITGPLVREGQQGVKGKALSAPGDSGGPLLVKNGEEIVLLATITGLVEPEELRPDVGTIANYVGGSIPQQMLAKAAAANARYSESTNVDVNWEDLFSELGGDDRLGDDTTGPEQPQTLPDPNPSPIMPPSGPSGPKLLPEQAVVVPSHMQFGSCWGVTNVQSLGPDLKESCEAQGGIYRPY